MSAITITRASPLTTIQDDGRPGMLSQGIGPSGPMDGSGFRQAEAVTGRACGAAIEFGPLGLDLTYAGPPRVLGLAGGEFVAHLQGQALSWPATPTITDGQQLSIKPGGHGNFGYLRMDGELAIQPVLGSRSTNAVVGLGGLDGRALRAGDVLPLTDLIEAPGPKPFPNSPHSDGAIRVLWGLHADLFSADLREKFSSVSFSVSPSIDRMGFRLADPEGVFDGTSVLGLVSDSVVAGDIQILGDGTPIVLMADHQPTGGYPRIATIIDADRDRFAQMRPGQQVQFLPVSVSHAHAISGARP